MTERPEPPQACVSPNGFVAQRMPISINNKGHWLLTSMVNEDLVMSVHADDEVESWPRLVIDEVPADPPDFPDEWPFCPGDVLEVQFASPKWVRGVVSKVEMCSDGGPRLTINYMEDGYRTSTTFEYRQARIRRPDLDETAIDSFRRSVFNWRDA